MAQLQTTGVTGSLTVTGNITAQTLVVQQVTSSVLVVTGSTKFGSLTSNVQEFTGSLRVTGSGPHYIIGGNVGIGTSSPNHMLDILTDKTGNGAGSTIRLNRPNNASFENAINWATNGTSTWFLGSDNDSTDNFYLYNWLRGAFELTVLSGSGNVGIGTTAPGYKLSVIGGLVTAGTTATQLAFLGADGSNVAYVGSLTNHPFQIRVNNSTRVTIDTNGNVGIGSVTPGATLDVNGNVRATSFTGSFSGSITTSVGSNTQVIYNNAGVLAGSNNFTFNGTNVGIGTTNPTAILTIDAAEPRLRLNRSGVNHIIINHDGTTGTIRNESNTPLQIGTNGVAVMTITGSNVGIGATNPIGELQIGSSWTANPGGGNTIWLGTSGVANSNIAPDLIITSNTSATTPGGTIGLALHNSNTTAGAFSPLLVFSKTETGASPFNAAIAAIGARTVTGTGASDSYIDGDLIFYTSPTAGSGLVERLRIIQDGNVGIGTTSPITKLQINTSAYTGAGPGDSIRVSNNGSAWISADNSGSLAYFGAASTTTAKFAGYNYRTGTNIDVILGQESMYIKADGNVGIGTTSPTDFLHLYASGNDKFLKIENTNSYTGIWLQDSGANNGWLLMSGYTNVTSPGDFSIREYGVQTSLTIKSGSGNIGIGTISPVATLHVSSSAAEAFRITGGTVNGLYSTFFNGAIAPLFLGFGGTLSATATNNDGVIRYNSSYNLIFTRDGSEAARFNSSGNLGIGTTTPVNRLHVIQDGSTAGISVSGGTNPQLRSTDGTRIAKLQALSDRGIVGTESNNDFAIFANNSEAIRITTIGDVGIGTTSPSTFGGGGLTLGSTTTGKNLIINSSNAGNNGLIQFLDTAGSSAYQISATTTQISLYGYGARNMVFFTNETSRLFVSSSGNVGIGTTSPSEKLAVVGNLYLNTNDPYIYWDSNNIRFKTKTASIPVMELRASTSGNYAGRFYIYDGNDSTVNVNINGSGTSYFNGGNVGIGINSPTAKLHISGSTNSVLRIESEDASDTNPLVYIEGNKVGSASATAVLVELKSNIDFRGRGIVMTVASASQSNIRWFAGIPYQGGGYSIGYDSTSNQLPYYYASSSLFIDTSRNVGIGTTSPTDKLNVIGNVNIPAGNYYKGGTVNLIGSDGAANYINAAASLYFYQGGNYSMYIGGTGNVGINTTSPAAKLQVVGNAIIGQSSNSSTNATIDLTAGGSAYNSYIDFGYYGTFDAAIWLAGYWGADGGGQFKIKDASSGTVSDRFVITQGATPSITFPAGNVGIGTTSATSTLQVNGSLRQNNSIVSEYKNVVSFALDSNGTGGYVIKTPFLIGTTYEMVILHVKGYGYGTSTLFDFKIVWYDYNDGVGVFDPVSYSIIDNGNDGLIKYLGRDSSGYVNVLFGGLSDVNYFYRFTVDCITTRFNSTSFQTGWSFTQTTSANYGMTELYTLNPPITNLTNGNVGIGTISPANRLHVFGGSDTAASLKIQAETYPMIDLNVNNANANARHWRLAGVYNSYGLFEIMSGTSQGGAPTTTRLSINGVTGTVIISSLAGTGDRIVGTNSSGVLSAITIGSGLSLSGGTLTATGGSAGSVTGTGASSQMAYWTSTSNITGSSNFVFDGATGNVGIGTTSPTQRLHVSGQTYIDNGAASGLYIKTSVADNNTRDAILLYENDGQATGRQAISWYNGTQTYYKARLWTEVGSGYGATQFGIDTADDARSVATRLIIRNGNVGIGTTFPSYKLDIGGPTRIQGNNTNGPLIVNGGDGADSYTRASIALAFNVTNGYYNWIHTRHNSGTAAGNAIDFYTGDGVEFGTFPTNGVHGLTISAGNVGVGTTIPYDKLEVNGAIAAAGAWGGNNSQGPVTVIGYQSGYGFIQAVDWGSTYLPLGINPNGGNVGIGTNSPTYKLDVHGGGATIRALSNTTYTDIALTNTSTTSYIQASTTNMYFYVAGGSSSDVVLSLDGTNNNVGIGTTTPVSKLQLVNNVSGGGFSSFGSYQILLWTAGTAANSYGMGIESETFMFNSDVNYKFYVDNVAKVLINSSGTITAAGDLVAYGSPSDISLKTIKGSVTNALDSIIKLNGYKFDWKEPNEIANIKEDIGVIAQEVEEIFPELVRLNKDTGIKSVRYQGLIPVLIEAIKEQQKQIDELKYLLKNK